MLVGAFWTDVVIFDIRLLGLTEPESTGSSVLSTLKAGEGQAGICGYRSRRS